MTYIQLDDGFPEHQKVIGLSDAAFRLYVAGLCYASRRETDGTIPRAAVRPLHPRGGLARHAQELVDAALWEPLAGDAFAIHDYLKHQRSKAQIEEQKEAARARLQRFRQRAGNGDETPMKHVTNGEETLQEGRGQSKRSQPSTKSVSGAAPKRRQTPHRTEPPTVSEEFIGRMVERWAAALGGEAEVRIQIERALNHQSALKAINVERYVDVTWLRNEAAYRQQRNGESNAANRRPAAKPWR